MIHYKALATSFMSSWVFIMLGIGYYLQSQMERGPEELLIGIIVDVMGLSFLILVAVYSVSVLVFSGKVGRRINGA